MPSTDYETVFTTTRLNQRRAVPLTAQETSLNSKTERCVTFAD